MHMKNEKECMIIGGMRELNRQVSAQDERMWALVEGVEQKEFLVNLSIWSIAYECTGCPKNPSKCICPP